MSCTVSAKLTPRYHTLLYVPVSSKSCFSHGLLYTFLWPLRLIHLSLLSTRSHIVCGLLGPVYMEKRCTGKNGHPPTRATLGEPTFHKFPYKTWWTIENHEKQKVGSARRATRLAGLPTTACQNLVRYSHLSTPQSNKVDGLSCTQNAVLFYECYQ